MDQTLQLTVVVVWMATATALMAGLDLTATAHFIALYGFGAQSDAQQQAVPATPRVP
jgi:hypothetical protein